MAIGGVNNERVKNRSLTQQGQSTELDHLQGLHANELVALVNLYIPLKLGACNLPCPSTRYQRLTFEFFALKGLAGYGHGLFA